MSFGKCESNQILNVIKSSRMLKALPLMQICEDRAQYTDKEHEPGGCCKSHDLTSDRARTGP